MSERPDVLVIMTDQQQARCLGCAGHPDLQTPHLDALAADGTRYAESFCPYPVCTPSRYSFLTGRYVHQHLGWSNHSTIPSALPTWPKALRAAGYATACVGKMHFHPTYLDVGFERMLLAEQNGPGRDDDDYHRYLRSRGLHDRVDLWDQVQEFRDAAPERYWDTYGALESDLPEEHHSTTWIAERALEQLQSWRDPGNCLMVSFIKPHHPFDPPAPWSRRYDPDALELPPGWLDRPLARDLAEHAGFFPHAGLDEARLRRCMALYYGSIAQIDHQVGRLIAQLRASGRYDDSLIVFTSDHGDYLGFHHLLLKNNQMYDPLMRVPLVVKLPGERDRGAVDHGLVQNLDLAPTICAAAGVPWHGTTGRDLAAGGPGPDLVFAENGRPDGYMVRSRTRKLIERRDPARSLFFDLERDPLEMEDRIEDPAYAVEIAAMRERLTRWALFDCPSPHYADAAAPLCPGDNVLPEGGAHREASRAYWRRCMAE